MGFVQGGESNNDPMQRKTIAFSHAVQDEKKHQDPLPSRGLGCFLRHLSLSMSMPDRTPPTQLLHENNIQQNGEKASSQSIPTDNLTGQKGDEDALMLRRPRGIPREYCELKSSAVIFPVASFELLSAFTEKRRSCESVQNNDVRMESQNANEEWQ